MYPSDAFAFSLLTPPQRAALGNLPSQCDLPEGIVAVHGTPSDDNQYLLEDAVDGRLVLAQPTTIAQRLRGLNARLLLCAHSHQPRIVQSPGGTLIVNPGSVGCPAYSDPTPPAHVSESGSPHARYAMLSQVTGRWSVDLLAIEYDSNAASMRASNNGRPEWARALKTGFIS
jgi:diadenosine tetraphosphatase ApaH/serine/threonine PP2A family protein phosphatase